MHLCFTHFCFTKNTRTPRAVLVGLQTCLLLSFVTAARKMYKSSFIRSSAFLHIVLLFIVQFNVFAFKRSRVSDSVCSWFECTSSDLTYLFLSDTSKLQNPSRKQSVSKSLKHLFHSSTKFVKTLKRSVYFMCLNQHLW